MHLQSSGPSCYDIALLSKVVEPPRVQYLCPIITQHLIEPEGVVWPPGLQDGEELG